MKHGLGCLASLVALILVIYALWVRRWTWRVQWEIAATLNVVLQSVELVILSSLLNYNLDSALHRLTGVWNLTDLIGHLCYMFGLMAVLYSVVGRLDMSYERFSWLVNTRIALPASMFIPFVICLFFYGGLGREYSPDLTLAEPSRWLMVYWWTYVAGIVYLLVQALAVILALRKDPDQKRPATVYLVAICVSLASCLLFVLDAPLDLDERVQWVSIRVELAAYAVAASYSWRTRVKALTSR